MSYRKLLLCKFSIFFCLILAYTIPIKVQCQQVDTSFSFTLNNSAKTSAGIYKDDGTLVRTLWSGVNYTTGRYKIKWDGTDDFGKIVPNNSYTAKVLSNNVNYTWEGGRIGNTSVDMTGIRKYHSLDPIQCMAISDSTAYFGTGYNEGNTAEFKFALSNPGQRDEILPLHGYTSQVTIAVVSDGTNVYWAGTVALTNNRQFVFATKKSDNTQASFSSGATLNTSGQTYQSAIDYVDNADAIPTALACSNGYLFVAHPYINEIHVLRVGDGSGALVHTITSFTNPKDIKSDGQGHVWVLSGSTTVAKYTVNPDGTLSAATLSIAALVAPLAIGVSVDGSIMGVCDGRGSQQVKLFNTTNGNPTAILGSIGGYANDPAVNNNKFYFSDQTGAVMPPFISFAADGSFWVNDPGNYRVQHYGSDHSFIDRIMCLPRTYSMQVCNNDSTRVFAGYQEFKIDYAKPLDNGLNGSWILVKNWRQSITPAYYNSFDVFSSVTTYINGRTYGLLYNLNIQKYEFAELPATGSLRYTSVSLNSYGSQRIYSDGSLRSQLSTVAGNPASWTSQTISFDQNYNPVVGSPVVLASTNQTTVNDPIPGSPYHQYPASTTSSNLIISFNAARPQSGGSAGYHLGGIKVGDTSWLWKTALPTRSDYSGDFPTDGYFDIGNGVDYTGNVAMVMDRNIFWGYNGEAWRGGQTNIYNHVYDNGLFVGQFGSPGGNSEMAPPKMAGNAFAPALVKVGNDYYLYHNDESYHGAIHRWKITGLNTVQVQSIPLTASFVRSSEVPILPGLDLMAGLPFNSVLQNNTNGWTRSPAMEDLSDINTHYWSASTGKNSYDKRKPTDLNVKYVMPGNSTPCSLSRDLGTNGTLSNWTLSGLINYEGNTPNSGINMYLEILDKAGKILVRFYNVAYNIGAPNYGIEIFANNTVIAPGSGAQIDPILNVFQPLDISMTGGIITVKYAGYPPVTVNSYDSSGNVTQPKTMRLYFEYPGNSVNYGKIIDMKEMRFIQNTGLKYFQSKTSGNWSDIRTWQSSADSTTWVDADTIPSSAAETISILNGHTIKLIDTATVDQLVINKGGFLLVTPNSTLKVNDGPDDDITIKPSGSLVIQSDSTGSGKIGNSSGTIKGDVTVERYISSAKKSSYRLLAPSVNTLNSIKPFIRDNWQEGQNNTISTGNSNSVPYYGTQITGSVDGTNGFDASSAALPTLHIYDQISASQKWMQVSNTDITNLEAKKGYLIYIQGDRSIDIHSTNSSNTTLRTTGSILMGTQRYPDLESDGRVSLITNPYASPINWNTVYNDITTDNAANFQNYFIYWDPNVGTDGGYVSVQANGTTSANTSNSSLQIQSGQAFFVVTKAGISSPSFTIKESHKSSNSSVDVFRSGSSENFMTSLYYNDTAGKRILADAVNAVFDNSFSNNLDQDDAIEIANRNENFAILRSGKKLSIEGRSLILDADTLPLIIQNLQTRNYEWQFDPSDFNRPNLQASLVDRFLNNRTPISLTAGTTIPFSVTGNAESAAENRFQVVFAPAQTLPVSITLIKAYQKEARIEVDWTAQNESNIDKYEIEKSINGSTFTMAGTVQAQNSLSFNYSWFDSNPLNGSNYYRIKTIDKSGNIKYTKIVNVKINNGNGSFEVYPNPLPDNYAVVQFNNVTKGLFTLNLINSNGQIIYNKTINHSGGSASQTIQIDTYLPRGSYTLQIIGKDILFNKRLVK